MNNNQPTEESDSLSNKNLSKENFSGQDQELIEKWYQKLAYDELHAEKPSVQHEEDIEQLGAEMATVIKRRITSLPGPTRHKSIWEKKWLYAAASIFLFISGIAAVINRKILPNQTLTILSNSANEVKEYDLPDGSHIWLNKNSKGEYYSSLLKDERRFVLYEGEAFFEVKRDTLKPFFVEAPGFTIKVLGTSFNVKTLKDISTARVTVVSGEVRVKSESTESGILRKDDQLIINRDNGVFTTRKTESGEGSAWRTGQIYLDDVSFSELAKTLEVTFNIGVEFPQKALASQRATLHFDAQDKLPEILQIICDIYGVSYTFTNNQVKFK